MKTDNIRKMVWTNYATNVYKNRDCLGSVADFFFFMCKKITVGSFFDSRSGNRKHNIFFRPNVMLKFLSWNMANTLFFPEKNCKSYSHFCSININVFENTLTVNEFVIYKLVKLTMLWTTGPRSLKTSYLISTPNTVWLDSSTFST